MKSKLYERRQSDDPNRTRARSRGSNYALRHGTPIVLPFALSQLDGERLFRAIFRLDQPWGL